MPTPQERDLLRIPVGVPLLRVLRTAYSNQLGALEATESLYPADRVVLVYPWPAEWDQPTSPQQTPTTRVDDDDHQPGEEGSTPVQLPSETQPPSTPVTTAGVRAAGSGARIRTVNLAVNSRLLYR
jgi:hypothetical protein